MAAWVRGLALLAMLLVGSGLLVIAWSPVVLALEPGEALSDPALEVRARSLSAELRCPVCQNQSIDDSNAPLARDLRLLVRERLTAGDSDRAAIDYIVNRYGEFVLLRPRFGWHTLVLWLAPLMMLAAAVGYIGWGILQRASRGRSSGTRADDPAPLEQSGLSPAEQARLQVLVGQSPDRASDSR